MKERCNRLDRDSRAGITLSKKELHRIDTVVICLIWQGHSPYQTAKENFDMDVLLALQLKPIEPDKINLTPELIK